MTLQQMPKDVETGAHQVQVTFPWPVREPDLPLELRPINLPTRFMILLFGKSLYSQMCRCFEMNSSSTHYWQGDLKQGTSSALMFSSEKWANKDYFFSTRL